MSNTPLPIKAASKPWPLMLMSSLSLLVFLLPILFLFNAWVLHSRERMTRLAIERNDPSLCEDISSISIDCGGDIFCKQTHLCFRDVAEATKNALACDMIGYKGYGLGRLQLECYESVIQTPQELKDRCHKISDPDVQGECTGKAALSIGQPSACDTLDTIPAQRTCYVTYIEKTPQPALSLCEQIAAHIHARTRKDVMPACYQRVALHTLDISICEKLTEQQGLQWCKDEIARRISSAAGSQ